MQTVTFLVSLIVQAATMIVTAVAFSRELADVLKTIVTLELVVQIIEFAWYSIIGLVWCRGTDVKIAWRYFDWFFTTPTMLISLLFFVLWLNDNCITNAHLFDHHFDVVILVIILFDWLMLLIGFSYEIKWNNFDIIKHCCFDRLGGKSLGVVALIGAFAPIFIVALQHFSYSGAAITTITFVLWLYYGIVALMIEDEEPRNTAYNVLDVLSKNVMGVVISIVAMQRTKETQDMCLSTNYASTH